jgi:hypothetical protein
MDDIQSYKDGGGLVDHWFHPHLQLMFYITCLI